MISAYRVPHYEVNDYYRMRVTSDLLYHCCCYWKMNSERTMKNQIPSVFPSDIFYSFDSTFLPSVAQTHTQNCSVYSSDYLEASTSLSSIVRAASTEIVDKRIELRVIVTMIVF